jgi:hypothetical protein
MTSGVIVVVEYFKSEVSAEGEEKSMTTSTLDLPTFSKAKTFTFWVNK